MNDFDEYWNDQKEFRPKTICDYLLHFEWTIGQLGTMSKVCNDSERFLSIQSSTRLLWTNSDDMLQFETI